MKREIELKETRFGEVVFRQVEPVYSKRTTNSDVLPEFSMEGRKLVVTTQDGSQQISKRYGWAWVHTNFPCSEQQDRQKRLEEHVRTCPTCRTHCDACKTRAELLNKCTFYNNTYGCTMPCEKALDFSEDRSVVKIRADVFFNNKYGGHGLTLVYFAVVKKNNEGIPTLYVRRRPAREPFLSMTAEEYQQKYVAKNRHVKNSFCICLYTPPTVGLPERAVEV